MTARARVHDDLAYDGVAVIISPRRGAYRYLSPIDQFANAEMEANEGSEPPPGARLMLRHDEARALYQELSRFYGGVHDQADVKALRGDYDHERRRVDKLIDHLIAPPPRPEPAPRPDPLSAAGHPDTWSTE